MALYLRYFVKKGGISLAPLKVAELTAVLTVVTVNEQWILESFLFSLEAELHTFESRVFAVTLRISFYTHRSWHRGFLISSERWYRLVSCASLSKFSLSLISKGYFWITQVLLCKEQDNPNYADAALFSKHLPSPENRKLYLSPMCGWQHSVP